MKPTGSKPSQHMMSITCDNRDGICRRVKFRGGGQDFDPDTAALQRKIASWAKLYHCRKNDEPGLVFQMTALPFQMSALRKTQ